MLLPFLLSLTLLFSTPSVPMPGFIQVAHHQNPEEIPLKENGNHGTPPRQETEAPILAYYLAGTVIISFLQDLGNVEITIDEESSGTILQTIVDSSTLSAILPLNMSSGEFSIYFTIPSGDEYSGQFSL